MNCRLCFSVNTYPVPWPIPVGEPAYYRCTDCGSDSAPTDYRTIRHHYNTDNAIGHIANGGTIEDMRRYCSGNCEWFDRAGVGSLSKTFLDVGSCDGSALDNMKAQGWTVQGFDVLVPPDNRHPVLTAEEFRSDLFPTTFSAVLSREVIEHVPDPHGHLQQIVAACSPGGLVQVQTPRPMSAWNPLPYQTLHLFVIYPDKLQSMLADAGLTIIDRMIWMEGQAYLCRK